VKLYHRPFLEEVGEAVALAIGAGALLAIFFKLFNMNLGIE